MELLLRNWYNRFLVELRQTVSLKIVSPFVKEQLFRKIQEDFDFNRFELITRFNLRDFACGVSSLEGLKFAVSSGASIYGIKDLHSKIYLFDRRSAIISSANFTNGGLINNFECGILITDRDILDQLHHHFDQLKDMGGNRLTIEQCERWQQECKLNIYNTELPSLPDHGATRIHLNNDQNYYVKFFGISKDRVPLTFTVRQEIDRALCHYACGFSENKKPRQINSGDTIYLARMTKDPNDFAIFGKAQAVRFVDDRDRATEEEIEEREWKENWPIYLRIKSPAFIDGTMADCVLLYDLIKALDYASFASTRERFENNEREINPYLSLSRQAYIKLSLEGAKWVESRFQQALLRMGAVPEGFIEQLPSPSIDYNNIE